MYHSSQANKPASYIVNIFRSQPSVRRFLAKLIKLKIRSTMDVKWLLTSCVAYLIYLKPYLLVKEASLEHTAPGRLYASATESFLLVPALAAYTLFSIEFNRHHTDFDLAVALTAAGGVVGKWLGAKLYDVPYDQTEIFCWIVIAACGVTLLLSRGRAPRPELWTRFVSERSKLTHVFSGLLSLGIFIVIAIAVYCISLLLRGDGAAFADFYRNTLQFFDFDLLRPTDVTQDRFFLAKQLQHHIAVNLAGVALIRPLLRKPSLSRAAALLVLIMLQIGHALERLFIVFVAQHRLENESRPLMARIVDSFAFRARDRQSPLCLADTF